LARLAFIAAACAAALAFVAPAGAQEPAKPEGCPRLISHNQPRIIPASLREDELSIRFVGHATFLIETPGGVRVATDYNDYVRPQTLPNVITMNRAHSTHYTNNPDPRIEHVLRGWDPRGGGVEHDVNIADMRIRNVSTNIRGWGGSESGGNSIFVFEAAQLCVAHLGHLHHELTIEHLRQLGRIDVALVPVDGSYTLSKEQMIEVVRSIQPMVVVPMHFFSQHTLNQFLDIARERFSIETMSSPVITLSRDKLPRRTTVMVLPGR
jgi:L-ascorbate metabolism protein UlaG (beta-lactamase superfamily)